MNPMGAEIALNAQIRNDERTVPFRIVVDDGAVKYQFEKPDQEIELRMTADDSVLEERVGGRSGEVKPARNEEGVRGTAITYEDLALRILYRPYARILKSETIRTRDCWKIEVQGGYKDSRYGAAYLWIDKKSGALMRIEGYGMDGKILKRFEVLSARKIDGQWMLKSMRVESYDPETHKRTDRTYLEVLGKA